MKTGLMLVSEVLSGRRVSRNENHLHFHGKWTKKLLLSQGIGAVLMQDMQRTFSLITLSCMQAELC